MRHVGLVGRAEGIRPAGIAVVLSVADLNKIIAAARSGPNEIRVGKKIIVVAGQFPTSRIEDGQQRVEVFLEIVNFVLQPRSPDLKSVSRPGDGVESIDVHVLGHFDPATGDARQRQRVGAGQGVVVALFLDDRIIDDKQLTDGG